MTTPSRLPSLLKHLEDVAAHPENPLDTILIDAADREVVRTTDKDAALLIITGIAHLLPLLQQDPAPLQQLAISTIELVSYRQLSLLKPPIDLVSGLQAENASVVALALAIVKRAAQSYQEADMIAENAEVVPALVRLALLQRDICLGETAVTVLSSLLQVNHNEQQTPRLGKVWKKIFDERDTYDMIFSICGSRREIPGGGPSISCSTWSTALARLYDFLIPLTALDWECITQSHWADIEKIDGCRSLLDFAVKCAAYQSDDMMQVTYLNFLTALLANGAPGLSERLTSPSLELIIESGVHNLLMGTYTGKSGVLRLQMAASKNALTAYVARYIDLYPSHFKSLPHEDVTRVLDLAYESINISRSKWVNSPNMEAELRVVAALPRTLLLQRSEFLSVIPCDPLSPPALWVLAAIFEGPIASNDESKVGGSRAKPHTDNWKREAAAARALYLKYTLEHTQLWDRIAKALETVTVLDTAFAACQFVESILKAQWLVPGVDSLPEPGPNDGHIPTDTELRQQYGLKASEQLPTSGLWAFFQPPALRKFIPHMLSSSYTSRSVSFRGTVDSELVRWKYSLLLDITGQLRAVGAEHTAVTRDMLNAFEARVAKGPVGSQRQQPTPEVATQSR